MLTWLKKNWLTLAMLGACVFLLVFAVRQCGSTNTAKEHLDRSRDRVAVLEDSLESANRTIQDLERVPADLREGTGRIEEGVDILERENQRLRGLHPILEDTNTELTESNSRSLDGVRAGIEFIEEILAN